MFTQAALVHEMENLRKFALRLTRNSADADDLLQTTILRALEKRHMFEPGSSLFKWMSKMMFNLFVSEYRKKTRYETQYDPEEYINLEYVEADQEDKAELRAVNDAMQTLSADHKEILIMVCVKGMQYEEVAGTLNIPVGTVRSRLSRAREQLQLALNEGRYGNVSHLVQRGGDIHAGRMAA